MEKISIVIPVYNASETIDRCLDSVINQTLKDLEIICINDGSKDDSLDKLDSYKKKDKRIIVLDNISNKGVSFTKNRGIAAATGEFICFVDSDDYIEKNMVKKMTTFQKKNNLDLVKCHYNNYIDGKLCNTTLDYKRESVLQTEDELRTFTNNILSGSIPAYLQLIMVRRKFLEDNNLKIDQKINFLEDLNLMLSILMKKPRMGILNERLYNYVNNKNGLTFSLNNEKVLKRIEGILYYTNNALNITGDSKQKEIIINRSTYLLIHSFFELYRVEKNNKQLIKDYFNKEEVKKILNNCNVDNMDRFTSKVLKFRNNDFYLFNLFKLVKIYIQIKERR